MSRDKRGYVIKLPTPHEVEGGFMSVQGLYCDQDPNSWALLWRLFRASLYHLSLHAAFSDFGSYAEWAKGKELNSATFAVSLAEDLHTAVQASKRWPGIIPDIAFANYISALRIRDPNSENDPAFRVAVKVLLEAWGVNPVRNATSAEDKDVKSVAERARAIVEDSVAKSTEERRKSLVTAAGALYTLVSKQGELRDIPSLPHSEFHGGRELFDNKLVARKEGPDTLKLSAFSNLGLTNADPADNPADAESREAWVDVTAERQKLEVIRATYESMISNTHLDGVEFPYGDYGTFLRTRASLAGSIKNVRDQLRLVKNLLDDTSGHEGGQLDTQSAIQVIASGQIRNDVFIRTEPTGKDEAWAILLDASKSISGVSREVRGIGTCLAEVTKELIQKKHQWGMYSFNNSFQVIKDFSEEYGITSKARIGGLEQRSATLLPDALMTAFRALSAMPVDIRILVVVSDGYPVGYSEIEEKLLEAVDDIAKSGTFLIGVGVDSKAIQDYFAVNCVLSSPYEMMKSFVKSYLELSSMF
jgi:hypothetical protein